MTWGSNPTWETVKCPYCGQPCVDDEDDGPSHYRKCWPWYYRLWWWLT